uniref:Uncharacterized protein n=1 Tax=Candidatus Kentrum sp. LPFa TaxID=2126335 RepID=A0A450X1L0_9GAMM|nr:MAG: hypothetical protein BECKLPF1236B_GA0070989_13433 [Candidatus Kentron sp. LPFa]
MTVVVTRNNRVVFCDHSRNTPGPGQARAPDSVCCGMVYTDGAFSRPPTDREAERRHLAARAKRESARAPLERAP